jgi:hypothetical protein
MTAGDSYRAKAAEFRAKASQEQKPLLRRSFEALAKGYVLLAEQADRNSETDIVYGPFLPPRIKPDGSDQSPTV